MTDAAKQPWLKFWPDDWLSDEALSLCSPAARGLWIDLLCIMHKSPKRGYLLSRTGLRLTEEHLSVLCRTPTDQIAQLLAELENAGVFSLNSDGVPYSRRMVRDTKASKKGAKSAQKRWQKRGKTAKPEATENIEEIGSRIRGPTRGPNSPPNRNPTTKKPEARIPPISPHPKSDPVNGAKSEGAGDGENHPQTVSPSGGDGDRAVPPKPPDPSPPDRSQRRDRVKDLAGQCRAAIAELCRDARIAAPPAHADDFIQVNNWLTAGGSSETIVAAVEAAAQGWVDKRDPPKTLRVLDRGVRSAIDAAKAAATAGEKSGHSSEWWERQERDRRLKAEFQAKRKTT